MNVLDYFMVSLIIVWSCIGAYNGAKKEFVFTFMITLISLVIIFFGESINQVLAVVIGEYLVSSFITYIVVFVAGYYLSKYVADITFTGVHVDIVFSVIVGFLLAFMRTFLLIGIFLLFMDYVFDYNNQFEIIKTSRIRDYLLHLKHLWMVFW